MVLQACKAQTGESDGSTFEQTLRLIHILLPMNLLYTHWHTKTIFPEYPSVEDNPAGIKVSYVIENDRHLEDVKSLITPLSTFYNPEEEVQEFTDEEHAHHLVMVKVVNHCHQLFLDWFDLIKKTKKEIIVHLFESSPVERSNFFESMYSLHDPIHIFLKTPLIRNLVKGREQRVYIPENWLSTPKDDLLLSLDFKMMPWRHFRPEKERPLSIDLVGHLINFRIAGLHRLTRLEKGIEVEGNHRLVRLHLDGHFNELISFFSRGQISQSSLMRFLQDSAPWYKLLGPKMMLHVIGVYIQKHKLRKAEKFWKELNSSTYFSSGTRNEKLSKLYAIGRKIDVETWYQYLMEPAFDQAPLLSKKRVQELHHIVFKSSGEPSFWERYQRIISIHAEDTFQLKKSAKNSEVDLDGIQINPVISIPDRMRIFLEQHT